MSVDVLYVSPDWGGGVHRRTRLGRRRPGQPVLWRKDELQEAASTRAPSAPSVGACVWQTGVKGKWDRRCQLLYHSNHYTLKCSCHRQCHQWFLASPDVGRAHTHYHAIYPRQSPATLPSIGTRTLIFSGPF